MNKPRNYMLRMWCLLVGTLSILLLLYYLPTHWMSFDLKPIDMLSDLRQVEVDSILNNPEKLLELTPDTKSSEADIPTLQDSYSNERTEATTSREISSEEQGRRDSIYQQALKASTDSTFVAIEDYTSGHTALSRFFTAIRQKANLDRPVRIAVLGDSFTEADILVGPLRRTLQARYGGNGVGWMPLSNPTAGYRPTIRHEFGGWTDRSVLGTDKNRQTFSGHFYTATDGAWVKYTLPKGSQPFDRATLYYTATMPTSIAVTTADTTEHVQTNVSEAMQALQLSSSPSTTLKLSLQSEARGLRLYGLALEGKSGISVDNMSLRGNSGQTLTSIDEVLSHRFVELRAYDLFILQYGLNVANESQTDYSNYGKTLKKMIARIRSVSPNADILIMSVSDRAQKDAQGIKTMRSIYYLHSVQQAVAQQTDCAFWSTLRAVRAQGGIGSMAERGLAAKDYTHLTHQGGKILALQFAEALMAEARYMENITKQ